MSKERLLKLNLGCGGKKIPGFINVDYSTECQPDMLIDLEKTPWSFDDNAVIHIVMHHSLEHVGQTPQAFINIMKELYRICANDAIIEITVPHPSHDNFFADPTHVRPITQMTLQLFDKEANIAWQKLGAANSPLALQCGVNFKIVEMQNIVDAPVIERLNQLRRKDKFIADMLVIHGRNIINEIYFKLKVIK